MVDVVEDCCGEVAGVVELGGVEELSGEDGEPHLDLVEPGGVGGGAVQEHAVVAVEELLDGFGAVGGEVVDDAVQCQSRRVVVDAATRASNTARSPSHTSKASGIVIPEP